MTDAISYYCVVYQVKASGAWRTRMYVSDGHLNSLRKQPGIKISSVKIVTPANPGEGLGWLDKVKNFFKK